MAENKFYKTRAFRELNSQWTRRLKQAGFNDIENSSNPDQPLSRELRPQTRRTSAMLETVGYYDLALGFLESGKFDSLEQKHIWSLHAHGKTLREIAEQVGVSKSTVDYQIKKVKNKIHGRSES